MPHAYCTTCEATVTVSDGQCLAGHTITTPIQESTRGRHRAPSHFDRFRTGKIRTAHHHRAPRAPKREQQAIRRSDPSPAPPIKPASEPEPSPPPPPAPITPQPAPVSWQPVETAPRSAYSSSMLEMLGMDEDIEVDSTSAAVPSSLPAWQAPVRPETRSPVGLDRLPSLSDMHTVNDHHADTGTLIERLWVATEEHDAVQPATELHAEQFPAVPSRTFRWSIIIAAMAVLALAIAVLQISVRMPERIAGEAVASYQAALTEAREVIPSADQAMQTITDPTATAEILSDAAVTLSELDTASRLLFTVASEPLASTPPLVARDELDALTPIRTSMANASQDGLAIERRFGDALTYRLGFAKAFPLPELPVSASSDEISALGVELGLGLAATLDALQTLPNDPAFESHQLQADSLAERFATWQIEYLSALRSADLDAATNLAQELQNAVNRVHTDIAGPLATVAAWGTDQIDRFGTALAELESRLP